MNISLGLFGFFRSNFPRLVFLCVCCFFFFLMAAGLFVFSWSMNDCLLEWGSKLFST